MNTTQFRPSVVGILGIKGEYPCLLSVQRETWNGYDCPRFTKEVGLLIVEAMKIEVRDDQANYDAAKDVFTFKMTDDDEPWAFPCSGEVDGVKRYDIGSRGWCWEEVARSCGIPESWPAAITSTADLLTLINALHSENRGWHFDDDPADVVYIGPKGETPTFTEAEAKHLRALREDCAALGGVWKMMEAEPSQACHKALGIMQPQTEEGQGSAGPGWAGPCPEGMDWSEHLARNNID